MYKRMDKLVAYISATHLFLVLDGSPSKWAPIASNQMQYDILIKCEDITKEEFESHLKTKNGSQANFESMYWAIQEESGKFIF